MPLYEYQCTKCGHRFERIQKFSDPLVETCPVCGGKVEKLLSAPAFTFKGTGFYITDYSRKGEAAAGEKAERAGKSEESKAPGESKEAGKSKDAGASDKPAAAKADSGADSSKAAPSAPAKPVKSE